MDKALPGLLKAEQPSRSGHNKQRSCIRTFNEADSFLPALQHTVFSPGVHQYAQITYQIRANSGIICIIGDMKLRVT